MNVCYLEGRIASNLERLNEKAPLQFRLEIKNENGKDYITVVAWGKVGAILEEKKVQKGDIVFITGSLNTKKHTYTLKDENGKDILHQGEPIEIKKEIVEIKAQKVRLTR